jgi:hypothetical protein
MSDRSIDLRPSGPSRSLGDVFGELSNELTRLVQHEMHNAKEELRADAPTTGRAAQLAFAAVAAGALAILFVSLAAASALTNYISDGWAFLAVGGVYVVVAGLAYWQRRSIVAEPLEPVDGNDY